MSTRLQEDLRKIVGPNFAVVPLKSQPDKNPIPGGRGIVYFDHKGNSQVAVGTPPVVNDDGSVEPGTTQPGGDRPDGGTSGGGSNSGNTLPPGDEPTPISDGDSEGQIYPVDNDVSVIDAGLGDTVKGVGGLKDCESGDPVDLRFDGEFSAPNGCGIPPEGYEEGFYWSNGPYGIGDANNPYSSRNDAGQAVADYYATNFPATWTNEICEYQQSGVNPDHFFVKAIRTGSGECSSLPGGFLTKNACGASTADYCTIPPPGTPTDPWPDANTPPGAETHWPSCKPTQLSYNNETAKFETNPFDDNVLPKFSQPVSQVTLCNEAGDTIKTFPTADGGHVIFNQDNNIGVFLDDKGVVTGYGDGPAVTARQPR